MGKNFPHDVDTANRDQPTDVKALSKHTPKKEIPQSPHPFNVTIEDLVKTNNHRQAGERGVSVSGKFVQPFKFSALLAPFPVFRFGVLTRAHAKPKKGEGGGRENN